MTMGRDARCDARLYSFRVSRFHCCVAKIEDGVHVNDLGSTNGTRINGRCVTTGRLVPGDELTIADLRYRVEEDPHGLAEQDQDERSARRSRQMSEALTHKL
jgi:pSer/pThr/pTyr-binding forkhead associated (FHA) protein